MVGRANNLFVWLSIPLRPKYQAGAGAGPTATGYRDRIQRHRSRDSVRDPAGRASFPRGHARIGGADAGPWCLPAGPRGKSPGRTAGGRGRQRVARQRMGTRPAGGWIRIARPHVASCVSAHQQPTCQFAATCRQLPVAGRAMRPNPRSARRHERVTGDEEKMPTFRCFSRTAFCNRARKIRGRKEQRNPFHDLIDPSYSMYHTSK